jgi:hypothetical protein
MADTSISAYRRDYLLNETPGFAATHTVIDGLMQEHPDAFLLLMRVQRRWGRDCGCRCREIEQNGRNK